MDYPLHDVSVPGGSRVLRPAGVGGQTALGNDLEALLIGGGEEWGGYL
jgi:hypothetical protein